MNDQFDGNWDTYLAGIEQSTPRARALGVTDYFSIETYKAVRVHKLAGRLPDIELLFPNVEIRLDIKTQKTRPLNMHLLFSPEDRNHEQEIERLLGELKFEFNERSYSCTITDLTRLGRDFDSSAVTDRAALRIGVTQFKTSLTALRELFRREKWLRKNCLVAVAGSSNDGTAGLQEDGSYTATRREIEKFADIIFASTPKQREFWLGRLPGATREIVEADQFEGNRVATIREPRYRLHRPLARNFAIGWEADGKLDEIFGIGEGGRERFFDFLIRANQRVIN